MARAGEKLLPFVLLAPRVGGGGGGGGGGRYRREHSCTKTQIVIGVLFAWVLILTVVCIVLGSQITYSTNRTLSRRIDSLTDEHASTHNQHGQRIDWLGSTQDKLSGRVEGVSGEIRKLDAEVDRMEGRLRNDVRGELNQIRGTLVSALDKVLKSIQDIRNEVDAGVGK